MKNKNKIYENVERTIEVKTLINEDGTKYSKNEEHENEDILEKFNYLNIKT